MKKTRRIYNELGLQLRNKHPKRRVKAKLREDRTEAVGPNDVWAMDFVHDQLATGRKIRVLTMIDTFSRYVPVLDPRFSYRGEDVVATLDRVCREIGYPKTIRVDQGSEGGSFDRPAEAVLHILAAHNNVAIFWIKMGSVSPLSNSLGSTGEMFECAVGNSFSDCQPFASTTCTGLHRFRPVDFRQEVKVHPYMITCVLTCEEGRAMSVPPR